MAKSLRYSGAFLSKAGVTWRCDIWQETASAYPAVGDLDFPADDPLVIEWEHRDKEDVICGSTATLKVISPGDRTYADLYAVAPASIRLDIYRAGSLYWSGCLDPEFYEEPYQSRDGYEVSLIFSDFGIWGRLKYDAGSPYRTLRGILQQALGKAGINYSSIDESMISTQVKPGAAMTLADIEVRSDNFIDEDGNRSSLEDVVEGAFQPLSLKIVQREGKVWVFDINGLYGSEPILREVRWTGDAQTMGTDKTANGIKITFSPYAKSEISDGALEYKGKYDLDHYNLRGTAPADSDYKEYYSYFPDMRGTRLNVNVTTLGLPKDLPLTSVYGSDLVDFTIFFRGGARGSVTKGVDCEYFQIQPVLGSASDDCGIAYAFRTPHATVKSGDTKWHVHEGIPSAPAGTVLQTEKMFIPALSAADRAKFLIRYQQPLLVDCRYNPFQDASEYNEEDNQDDLRKYGQFVFVPVKIELLDASGDVKYHLRNYTYAQKGSVGSLSYTRGTWVTGADPGGDCWIEYYRQNMGKAGSNAFDEFLGGWVTNRHCVGRPDGHADRMQWVYFDSFAKMDDGEYISYPPAGGYLRITVMGGIKGFDYQTGKISDAWDACTWTRKDIYGKIRWLLYKAPKVNIVKYNQAYSEAKLEDMVYDGCINPDAKEGLEFETVCGSLPAAAPMARGAYVLVSDGSQVSALTRAGRTLCPEKLMIGTLCSQYGGRMTVLSGEAGIDGGLRPYSEANQGEARFMLTAAAENAIADCGDMEFTQIRPDEYDEDIS